MQTTQSTHWVWPSPAPFGPEAPETDPENANTNVVTETEVEAPSAVPVGAQVRNDQTTAGAAADDARQLGVPPRERHARREIGRLRDEIELLVRAEGEHARDTARDVIDSALESVTRLQIVTANIDACGPPPAQFAGPALVALADSRLTGHADAIERGMEYTADNQLRLLNDEK